MSFWDRLGDWYDSAAKWFNDRTREGGMGQVAPTSSDIGTAWSWASAMNDKANHSDFVNSDATKVFSAPVDWIADASSAAGGAINTVYGTVVGRPLSTWDLAWAQDNNYDPQTGKPLDPSKPSGTIFSADTWKRAWNASSQVSAGQSANIGVGLAPKQVQQNYLDTSDEAQRQRDDYFKNTWSGRLTSGALDFALNYTFDPLYNTGKVVKAVREERTMLKTADVAGAMNVARTGATEGSTRAEARAGLRINDMLASTDRMTGAEIGAIPELKSSPDAGALAYFFQRANESYPGATKKAAQARLQLKADVFGTALGDATSLERVRARMDILAAEYERMTTAPDLTKASEAFLWDDAGQGMLNLSNAVQDKTLLAQRDAVQREMIRLKRVIDMAGSVEKVGATALDRVRYDRDLARLHETYMNSGMGGRTIRVVNGAMSARLPGTISTSDATAGYEALAQTVNRMRYTPPEVRTELLNGFMSAATKGDRRNAVVAVEHRMFTDAAAHYGITDRATAEKLLRAAQARRNTYISALKSRLYSAAPEDDLVHLVDPEDDLAHVFSRPLLQSQIEDAALLTDPVMLDRALKDGTQSRLLERWAETLPEEIATAGGVAPLKAAARTGATKLSDLGSGSKEILDEIGRSFTKYWKDAALFRGAYPVRVQVDTQMRLAAQLGMMQYLARAKGTFGGELRYALSLRDRDSRFAAELARQWETGELYRGLEIAPSLGAEETAMKSRLLADRPGGVADIGNDLSTKTLREMRGAGNWGYVERDADNWLESYQRAVKQQIANSPTAMKAVETDDMGALLDFVHGTPAGRKEWLEMSAGWDTPEEWISAVVAHVNHYLPSAELRTSLLNGELTNSKVSEYFAEVADRMRVHGEAVAPTLTSNWTKQYNKLREGWYRFASDAPEMIMGRSPLYAEGFTAYMKRQIDRHPDEVIDDATLNAMRVNADKLARRDVGKVLFSSSHVSNLSSGMRFVSPFFAAWEDTMKKWGQLFYDDPSRIARFNQAWNIPNDLGVVQTDEAGTEWIVLPQSLLPGPGGSSWRIRKNSFNIIFQGQPWWLPGYGPMVQVPTNEVVKRAFPEYSENPVLRYVLPYGVSDNSIPEQMMPAWMRQAKNAFGTSSDYANTYALLMAQLLVEANKGDAEAQRRLKDGTAPDYIASQTRNWYILRAVSAWGSPVTAQPNPKFQFYIDQAHEYRTKFGADWQNRFFKDFPEYFEMSISLSQNSTGITASAAAMDATRKYRKHIEQNPDLGWMFVGPDNITGTGANGFNQGVYAWQKTTSVAPGSDKTFRGQRSPAEAIEAIEAERGWLQYNKAMTAFNLILEDRGLHSFSQKAAEDISIARKAYIAQLSASNPSWARAYAQQDTGKVAHALRVASEAMARDKELAARSDMVSLERYIQARKVFRSLLQERASHSLALNPDIEQAWGMYVQGLVKDNVGFEQLYNRLLSHDDLSKDVNIGG